MLRIDFANLTNEYPRFRAAWKFFAEWMSANPRVKQIELDRLAQDGRDVDAGELSAAIDVLLDKGLFERGVGVKDPDGTLLQLYPEDAQGKVAIPDQIPARDFSHYYDRDDLDLFEVYRVKVE